MEAASTQEAAKQDPKTGTEAAGEDLSMEEILHSIRKIIAEDDTDAKKSNGKAKGEENVPGSDVLELTEMVAEDGTVVSLKPEAAAPADVLKTIDQALTPEKPAEKADEKPAEAPAAPATAAAHAPAPAPVEVPAAAPPAKPVGDALLSPDAATEASASLTKLKVAANPEPPPVVTTPSPVLRSGITVEDMVMDMLKPMMKAWLDTNLPQIVERIVEREVKKLTK